MFSKPRTPERTAPGAAPGTIVVDPSLPKPTIRVLAYGPDDYRETDLDDVADVKAILGKPWPVVWVNVDGLGDADTIAKVGEVFGLHRLALEDVAHTGQRAKVEPYDEHLFIVLRMTKDPESNEQVSLFLGEGYVLTFQERPGDCLEPVRRRVRDGKGRIRKAGPDYLAYALIDAVIDGYFPALESIGDGLEKLEDEVFGTPEKSTLERIQQIKSRLRELRRASWPHRDVATILLRENTPYIHEDTRFYLRDISDHAVRVTEQVESYREEATDLMNAYLSSVSNRMNEIMKVLTIVASVFIPLSFVAGLYGMNFDREASALNMPELGWTWGYPMALGIMAAVAGGLLLYFRKKRWLG